MLGKYVCVPGQRELWPPQLWDTASDPLDPPTYPANSEGTVRLRERERVHYILNTYSYSDFKPVLIKIIFRIRILDQSWHPAAQKMNSRKMRKETVNTDYKLTESDELWHSSRSCLISVLTMGGTAPWGIDFFTTRGGYGRCKQFQKIYHHISACVSKCVYWRFFKSLTHTYIHTQ